MVISRSLLGFDRSNESDAPTSRLLHRFDKAANRHHSIGADNHGLGHGELGIDGDDFSVGEQQCLMFDVAAVFSTKIVERCWH